MQGRAYLDVARQLVSGAAEVQWRTAIGRAYYALMLECRDGLSRWGFAPLPRDNVHTFVRLRLNYAKDTDLKMIGRTLERLGRLRNFADYDLRPQLAFATVAEALRSIRDANGAISVLDAIEADATRRAAAEAAIRAAFP